MSKQRIWKHPKGVVVACDGTKLRDILYDKGYSLVKASTELKVGGGTFSRVYKLDRISSTVVALLEQFMDIRPSDYNVHMVEDLSWGEYDPARKSPSRCPGKNYNKERKPVDYNVNRNPVTPIVEKTEEPEEPVKAQADDKISITIDIDRDILKELIKEAVREAFNEI